MIPNSFPIARYQFDFVVSEPILLPEYSGSTLRGAFGRALRKIACMTSWKTAKAAQLYRTCPLHQHFLKHRPRSAHELQKFSQVPNGYIIEPPAWGERLYAEGETLTFSLVLFGRLIEQLPLIAFAFKRAFEYNVGRGKANLLDIAKIESDLTTQQSILQNGNIIEHQKTIEIPTALDSVTQIKIDTPLRLQENGKPLRVNEMTAERFFYFFSQAPFLIK